MTPDLVFWGRLLAVLTLEIALGVAGLTLVARVIRSPQLRRTLWQSGLVALVLILTTECAGFRAVVVPRIPETPLVSEPPSEPRRVATVRPPVKMEPVPTIPVMELSVSPAIAASPIPPPPATWWPGLLWLLGTTLLGLRALGRRGWLARERRRTQLGDTETQATIMRLQAPLGLRRVELRVWPRLRGPVAFGTLWPTVAVPTGFAVRFTLAQREAMLAHELAHLAGRDPFWLAVADVACALAWWHPGVWWARHRLRAASEEAADEASALVPGGLTTLAESLVAFGRELATPGPARSLGVAGSGFRSELGRRVAALLEAPPRWRPLCAGPRRWMRCVVMFLGASLATVPWPGNTGPSMLSLVAHAAQAPSVEVAPVVVTETSANSTNQNSPSVHVELAPLGLVANPPVGKPIASLQESAGNETTNLLHTRTYRLRDPAGFLAAIRQSPGTSQSTNIQADVRQFFESCGLDFPPPAIFVTHQPSPTETQSNQLKAIFLNDRTGVMFIRATLGDLDRLEKVIEVLSSEPADATSPQITLEVQLAEIRVGGAEDLGLDWFFGLSPTNNPSVQTTPLNPTYSARVDTLTSRGQWARLNSAQFGALRRSLEERPGVDILQAPAVTTSPGHQAQVTLSEVRTLVIGVRALVDAQTQAVGFDEVILSSTNRAPEISYMTEAVPVGPVVDITPEVANDGWNLDTAVRLTEFVGYLNPGKGNEPFVQAPDAKPLKATKALARLRVNEMRARGFVRAGDTMIVRGARVARTNLFISSNWFLRRTQTNVVTTRLYAFITPQFAPASATNAEEVAPAVQPVVVLVAAEEPRFRLGDRGVYRSALSGAQRMPMAEPKELVQVLSADKPGLSLLIRAGAGASPADVTALVNAAQQAGIPNVVLQDEPEKN